MFGNRFLSLAAQVLEVAPPRSRRPGSAGPAPAARPGGRPGSSGTAPSASSGNRCCRGASGGGAARETSRPARSGRPGARTPSGTRSRTGTSMIRSTASAMLSRCWMLTVVITSMPASSSSMTSCQRFSWRPDPARWCGRARPPGRPGDGVEHGVEVHLLRSASPGTSTALPVDRPPGPRPAPRCADRPWHSTNPMATSAPRCLRRWPSLSIAQVFPTPGAAPR